MRAKNPCIVCGKGTANLNWCNTCLKKIQLLALAEKKREEEEE
jgi:hypothetical protein